MCLHSAIPRSQTNKMQCTRLCADASVFLPGNFWLQVAMRSWFCVDVNNVQYLAADTAVKCWSNETNHSHIAVISVFVFLVYTIAFPVVLFFMLRTEASKRKRLIGLDTEWWNTQQARSCHEHSCAMGQPSSVRAWCVCVLGGEGGGQDLVGLADKIAQAVELS